MPDYKKSAFIFKAMSDPTRLEILIMLSKGTLCACDILEAFQITQPTLSYHMKILTQANLIESEKKGTWMHYQLKQTSIVEVKEFLEHLFVKEAEDL